jgi:hypothetical protein
LSLELTTLIYAIKNPKIGYIEIELYKAFEDRILKLYRLKAKNYRTGEYLSIEKYYGGNDEAIERFCGHVDDLLGFTVKQLREEEVY